jgi:glycosyltransferase involved in cell wall biosynthesis
VSSRANTNWSRDCAAVLPCYNEAQSLPDVLSRLRPRVPNIFVVDDGSSDTTASVAMRAGATVLRHETNCGKGKALRTGCAELRARGFTWALVLDGDGQHAPEDIPKFFACAEQSGAPLVVGNRLGESHKIPWVRRIVNRWMTARLSRLTGRALADSQCGFRLIHLETLAQLPLYADHFETESELLVRWVRAGLPAEFVPVQVIYRRGGSKINPVVDTWRWLRWWRAQPKNWPTSALTPALSPKERESRLSPLDASSDWSGKKDLSQNDVAKDIPSPGGEVR